MSETTTRPPTARPTREETRQRLLDGAYEAFSEVGFQAATIEDVCSRAGFTRGAFYSNFSSLDELLLALWDRQNDEMVALLRDMVDDVDSSDAPFERTMEALIELRDNARDWFVIGTEFLLHALRTPDLQERLEARRGRFRDDLRRGVEVLLAAQGRRPPDGIDVDTFAQLLIAGHLGCRHVAATDPTAHGLPNAMLTALLAACPPISEG
jgi:AcrR family transcriptional regulator